MARKLLVFAFALAAPAMGSVGYAQNIDERIRNVETLQRTSQRSVFGVGNELLTVGSEAMLAGRWEDGVRLTLLGLEQVGVKDSQRADGFSNLCGAFAALNQPDRAIDYCTQSIEIDEDNWRAWSNRSYAYWLKEQYDKAGVDLERATSINESARQLFQIRGMLNEAGLRPRILMEDRQ
jgi:tetratricopeptide (TPR) repeat protein